MFKIVSKNALILGFAAVACVGLVASVNVLTAPEIDAQAQQALRNSLIAVLPTGHSDSTLLQNCLQVEAPESFHQAKTQLYRTRYQNNMIYVTQTVAPDGYSGDILLLAAIRADGTIYGVRTLAHRETPGLGDKIEEKRHPWIYSFNQQQVQSLDDPRFAVKKDGGQFDQFAGATITPRAVVAAVKRAALYIKDTPALAEMTPNCSAKDTAHD